MPIVHGIRPHAENDVGDSYRLYYVTVSYPEFNDPEKRTLLFDNVRGYIVKKPNEGICVMMEGWEQTVEVAKPERFGPEFNEDWIHNYFKDHHTTDKE